MLRGLFLVLPAWAAPPQCPSATRLNIACVGDSITYGAHSGGNSYPKQLQALLDAGASTAGKYCVTNLGRSGTTVQKAPHGDAPYWNSSVYLKLIANKWDVVVVMLGTNDAKDACGGKASYCSNTHCCNWPNAGSDTSKQSGFTWTQDCEDMSCPFVRDYTSLIDVVKTLGTTSAGPVIYTAIPPPLMEDFDKPYGMNQTIINNLLPRIVPRINKANGLPHAAIDVFGALGGTSDLNCGYTPDTASSQNLCNHTCHDDKHDAMCHPFCDGQSCDPCHPNSDGYGVLAQTVMNAIFGVVMV